MVVWCDDHRKIWLLYPPAESNLASMKIVDGQRAKLAHALYIPAGCLQLESEDLWN